MPTYAFETITAEQALGLTTADMVSVAAGTAAQTTVIYNADQTISVTVGPRTVVFGAVLPQVTSAGGLTYADGSTLFVGDASANVREFQTGFEGFERRGAAYGGAGDDLIRATSQGAWLMQGNQGNDTLIASGATHNTIYGGQGDDRLSAFSPTGSGGGSFIQGNRGADTATGGANADTLLGGQDNDIIDGAGGHDFLNGNVGNDYVFGGGQIFGESGNDTLVAMKDMAATLRGGDGDDRLGTDDFAGSPAAVTLFGEAGNDTLEGNSTFADLFDGGAGNDVINSGINANAAGDTLLGGEGDDRITANGTADTLDGGAGADTLTGNGGGDRLTGGEGADVFVLVVQDTDDRITDWSPGDRLLTTSAVLNYIEATAGSREAAFDLARETIGAAPFTANNVGAMAIQVGADVIVFSGRNGAPIEAAVTLVGRSLADVSGESFV